MQEKKKAEAIKRMKVLKLHKDVIDAFIENNRLYYSERMSTRLDGVLYWLDNHPEYCKIVQDFEKKHGYLVYHVHVAHTYDFGPILTILYVDNDSTRWEEDRTMLSKGHAFAYVHSNNGGEFGYVGIKPMIGGISRPY